MSRTDSAGTVKRSYKNAIDLLNQQRRSARPSSRLTTIHPGLSRMPDVKGQSDMRGTPSIVGMKEWLQQLGHSTKDVDRLNIIHVAGTKGKGSTCAFVDALLDCHSERSGFPTKRGLYTSPHLLAPEERIRINSKPLNRGLFAKYFFEISDLLSDQNTSTNNARPRFLQLFFLLAIHTFIREGVDAAIIETHHGGEYDATNVIEQPVVTAVTSLGLDHVSQLGPSIENIAWHKAGIFKQGAAAFSVVEEAHIAKVLQQRATAKAADLTFVDVDPDLPQEEVNLQPDVQRLNCSLALAAVRSFVEHKDATYTTLHPDDVIQGVRRFSWPGRFQIVTKRKNTWYLDGAHNEMSVPVAAKWFLDVSAAQRNGSGPKTLIFGQTTEQRDQLAVLQSLAASFDSGDVRLVIFTKYNPAQDFEAPFVLDSSDTHNLQSFAEVWSTKHPNTPIRLAADVPHALTIAEELAIGDGGMHTLITGSQHLVAAALFAFGQQS